MKYTFYLGAILLFCISTFAQTTETDSRMISYWGDEKLTWNDFQGVPPKNSDYSSEISYGIGYRPFEKPVDSLDMDVRWIETYCYMDRGASWVKENEKTDINLLYNQTIFDIVELYSRRLQEEINHLSGSAFTVLNKLDELLREYDSKIKNVHAILSGETNDGMNGDRVNYWYNKTRLELSQLERKIIPDYQLGHWGLGVSFDLGYGFLSGGSKDYFSNNFNLSFGFDIGYRPIIFYLRGILGFNSVKKEFTYDNKFWEKDLGTGLAVIELTSGYPVVNNDDFSLTPFCGIGIVEFSVRSSEDRYKKQNIDDFTGVFGLNMDYKFSKVLNLLGGVFSGEASHWLIRARLTAAPFNMNENLKGWTVNFTLGVGGFINTVEY